MRYNLESTLPLDAFKPRGGLFAGGMTLHGGGGGGFLGGIVESVGDAFSGIGDAVGDVAQGIGDLGVTIDEGVNDIVPGGWGTVAAVAVPFLAPEAMMAAMAAELGSTAAASAALSAGTSAATSAVEGRSLEDTLKGAALSGALSYGLGSLGEAGDAGSLDEIAGGTDDFADDFVRDFDFAPEGMQPGDIPLSEDPYINQFTDAFNNPEISEIPAFEPTASTISSDIPNPDLIPQANVDPYESLIQSLSSQAAPISDPYENLIQSVAGSQDFSGQALPAGSRYERFIQELANTPMDSPAFNPAAEKSLYDRIASYPERAYDYLSETPISEMGSDLYNSILENPLTYGAGALGIAGLAGEGPLAGLGYKLGTAKMPSQSSGSSAESSSSSPKEYKYGISGGVDKNYLLRNRINAANVYSDAAGYRPVTRMADGGEVKHFGIGGIANAFTKVFQPIEKAIVRPVSDAVPFLKDVAPYAGMIAAPFIASPMAAAGVGALASGMGKGGFNMKRALMGGISAYGMSNLGAGLEAAGNMTPLAETEGVSKSLNANSFFRDPSMMAQGAENLMAGGDSYKLAAKNFGTQAGLPSAGMAILGQSGVSAVNEGIDQQAAYDKSLAASDSAQAVIDAKNKSARDRAIRAIRENPYQYAMGGAVNPPDDQTNMPSQTPMQKLDNNGLMSMIGNTAPQQRFAEGGVPRFLSGGGDGMSDSIRANIEGNQEARLADGEFVIPADVVSHLGNGSSKAGAKQLYSMMDRVRQARVGNKKQGKQINPSKLMAA
jgi:hypothetical protein